VAEQPFDVAVVGAGIIGLATARALTRRRPGLRAVVLEKEDGIARHQTGHSSGVVHSGVYYAPGSLKARLCVEGAAALERFCDEHGIPVNRCGKVIVAVDGSELTRLEELHRRAVANGVAGAALIERDRLLELEPHVAGVRALHVPGTAVVDFGLVSAALAADLAAVGVDVLTGREVTGIARRPGTVVLETGGGPVEARHVVVCAGLHSDRVAMLAGGAREPRIVPFRGDYHILRPERRELVNGLVYPVPDPAFPFLGVHTTLRPDGSIWLGPNALLATGREAYKRHQVDVRDLAGSLASPGFRRLARRNWRLGLVETARGYSRRLFVAAARRLLPELRPDDVLPGPSGIRAQALARDGSLVDDFVFDGDGAVLGVRNAPSPGATSSLAIAEEIADRAEQAFWPS
jgi:L-2-hydroxyglutarate oxidase LhgO